MRYVTFDGGENSVHLGISSAHPNVLCAGSAGRVELIARYLVNSTTILSDRKHVTVHGTYQGVPITAFSTGMSPGSVSITLPEVVEAYQGRKMNIIRIGTSGGLHPSLKVGDFVIANRILPWETTSEKIMERGYVPVPSPEVVEALRLTAQENHGDSSLLSQKVHVGGKITTDELYWTNLRLKKRYAHNPTLREEELGDTLAISMELSAICAIRDRYNRDYGKEIRAGGIVTVSDLPLSPDDRIDQGNFGEIMKKIEQQQIVIGLEALVKLANEKRE